MGLRQEGIWFAIVQCALMLAYHDLIGSADIGSFQLEAGKDAVLAVKMLLTNLAEKISPVSSKN